MDDQNREQVASRLLAAPSIKTLLSGVNGGKYDLLSQYAASENILAAVQQVLENQVLERAYLKKLLNNQSVLNKKLDQLAANQQAPVDLSEVLSKLETLISKETTMATALEEVQLSLANLKAAAVTNGTALADLVAKLQAANTANDPVLHQISLDIQALADNMTAADAAADPPTA
jgi:DNA repair exonuclease SbcCD ATPase subunit